jgi:hypothetical protein
VWVETGKQFCMNITGKLEREERDVLRAVALEEKKETDD